MDIQQEPFDQRQIEKIIEAVHFAAGHPLTYGKLAAVTGVPVWEVKRIAAEMREKYDAPDGEGRCFGGITLLLFEKECQLCTRQELESYIREALDIKKGGNLSASSLEVLAVIAYNEPVTRTFVDTVRGVDSAYAVGRLCERGLIEPCGRLDVPGRPLLYRTTSAFLRCFGLDSLAALPKVSLPKTQTEPPAIPNADA